MCLVGASTPRWRVVPSVTLGTGGRNSSVLRGSTGGTDCGGWSGGIPGGIIAARLSRSFKRMYCPTPLAINANAGINIQNHQVAPIDRDNAIEMITNATPD